MMPSSKAKENSQKAATLARVRENQRRCRARRRQHIEELERKLQELEAGKDPSEGDVDNKLKVLAQENEKLRALLAAAGLPRVWVEAFLKLGINSGIGNRPPLSQQNAPIISTRSSNVSEEVMFGHPPTGFGSEAPLIGDYPFNEATSLGVDTDFNAMGWNSMSSDLDLPQLVNDFATPSFEDANLPVSQEYQAASSCPTGTCCAESNSATSSDGDTTSCSVAFELIRRYNSKRLDMVEIWVRMWSGFRAGKNGKEDCSVNNKVLFGVLDHISC